jgi:hypothetical protein
MANILRPPAAQQKVSVKRTKFHEDYVLHDENDPYVPGTEGQVRRVRPVPLGERAVGFFEDEIDVLLGQLRTWRDAKHATQQPVNKQPRRAKQRDVKSGNTRLSPSREIATP